MLIDGIQVPFPVEELVLLTDTSAHVQLEFVDNQKEALELVGCQMYAAIDVRIQKIQAEEEQWTGFELFDTRYGKIGYIQKIENYNGNRVMHVMDGNSEILISLYPELVTDINYAAKSLLITAPEGYFTNFVHF